MNDVALQFLVANLAAGVAVFAVLALRKPARVMFGAPLAYALWLLVPLVAAAALLPPRIVEIIQPAVEPVSAPVLPGVVEQPALEAVLPPTFDGVITPPVSTPDVLEAQPPEASPQRAPSPPPAPVDLQGVLALVWLAGVFAAFVWQMRSQSRFMADARAGLAGPAVAGFLRPRIVTPSDFEERFDGPEREIILAHETIHLDRNDARINALVALVRCFCWFNPLVHAGAHFMRIDQELACDAVVVERHPKARGLYASALLKAQLAFRPLPLGCYWPAKAEHPLMERIEMLKRARPGKRARLAGIGALALLAIGSSFTAWAAKPPAAHYTTVAPAAPVESAPDVAPITAPLAPDAPAPAPLQPAPDDPQQRTPATPSSKFDDYDPTDPVYLRGKVEKIDFSDAKYTVFVRASSIADGEFEEARPDARLWELPPTPYWGDRDAVNADLKDSLVAVRGYAAKDKSCAPACKLLSRGIIVPRSTALPAVPPSAAFGVTEVAQIYDMNQRYAVQGRVQRIEFSDHVFDAYVLTQAMGPIPPSLFQVRSEYRIPRADLEKQLLDKDVQVSGWPARANFRNVDLSVWTIYSNCAATCAMYGTDFIRVDPAPDGRPAVSTKVMPVGESLALESMAVFRRQSNIPPVFGRPMAAAVRWSSAGGEPAFVNSRLVLLGKVTKAESYGTGVKLTVEEISRKSAPLVGMGPGAVWTVYLTPPAPDILPIGLNGGGRWVGHTVTFSGTAWTKVVQSAPASLVTNSLEDCERECDLFTSDAQAFD
jgi:beta-lactamase regulating signal transducer with metallopeptidase domain